MRGLSHDFRVTFAKPYYQEFYIWYDRVYFVHEEEGSGCEFGYVLKYVGWKCSVCNAITQLHT